LFEEAKAPLESGHMRKAINLTVMSMLASGVLVLAQGPDVAKVLAAVHEALGGDAKLAAVKSVAATGTYRRLTGNQTSGDYELAIELPDKFVQKQPAVSTPMFTLSRATGFNGDGLISVMDQPPQMDGMVMNIRSGAPGGSAEQQAALRASGVAQAKEQFVELTLGMFAASFSGAPVAFGAASAMDVNGATADAIDVKGAGDLAAKLVIDRTTHLPMMLIWNAKEPVQPVIRTSESGGDRQMQFVQGSGGTGGGQMPPDLAAQMQQMEANRKVVEYRLTYSDYRDVNGVKLPFHFARSIAGQPAEDVAFTSLRLNVTIDPKKFDVSK
jgi:hypothetical protein